MNINVPYNYINFLVFEVLLKYEGRRYISLSDLYDVYNLLVESVREKYKEDNFISDISYNLNNFIYVYSDYFYISNGYLCLSEDVSKNDFYSLVYQVAKEENVHPTFTRALTPIADEKIFSLLGISTIKDNLLKYAEIERRLENLYSKINYKGVSKEILNELKAMLLIRKSLISQMVINEVNNEAYYQVADTLVIENGLHYDKEPINKEIWMKQAKRIKNRNKLKNSYDFYTLDLMQYAIFGKDSISTSKLFETMDALDFDDSDYPIYIDLQEDMVEDCYDEENDEAVEEEIALYKSKISFYEMYLYQIVNYCKKYGFSEELFNAYNRLLYAIDSPNRCLFIEDNLVEELNNIDRNSLNLFDFKDEARFMAYEVFATPKDEFTLRKLLFVATYYDLTKDKKIIKIVNRHKKNKHFKEYSEIIFDGKENVRKLEK